MIPPTAAAAPTAAAEWRDRIYAVFYQTVYAPYARGTKMREAAQRAAFEKAIVRSIGREQFEKYSFSRMSGRIFADWNVKIKAGKYRPNMINHGSPAAPEDWMDPVVKRWLNFSVRRILK